MLSADLRRPLAVSILAFFLFSQPGSAGTAKHGSEASSVGFQVPINGALSAQSESSWSLPICGPVNHAVDKERTDEAAAGIGKLKGKVIVEEGNDKVGQRIAELLDAALKQDPQSKVLDKAVAHYRGIPARMMEQAKDATNFSVPYQGFGPSSEAGDVILDEKLKLKSRASAEYARQKHIDEMHVKVVESVMQIAMGLGMSDAARAKQTTATGLKSLQDLVGTGEAEKTQQMLVAWAKAVAVPESIYKQGVWDISQRNNKFKKVMESALDRDPVVQEIQTRLHKYNHRSKFARVSAHVVETALGVAGMAPDFVGAGAKAALSTFIMATGGPEQSKVLKELYLDKRFESRWKVLTEETHLALDNYHVAILTHNSILMACSESLVKEMGGTGTVGNVFGQSVLPEPTGTDEGKGSAELAISGSTSQ
jgi:hypothetical protein